MLQNNSFFSDALIFFGLSQNSAQEDEEWFFSDPWLFAQEVNNPIQGSQKIELCIHWSEV